MYVGVDNHVNIWVDNQYISGQHDGWEVPKHFTMPRSSSVIAMEALNTGGPALLVGYIPEFGLGTSSSNVRCWLGRSTSSSENIDFFSTFASINVVVALFVCQIGRARASTTRAGQWRRSWDTTVSELTSGEEHNTFPPARSTCGRPDRKKRTLDVDGRWVMLYLFVFILFLYPEHIFPLFMF